MQYTNIVEPVYLELTIVICLAAGLSIVFRFFKQPAILAYILTGILLGPLALFRISSGDVMHSLGQIGITLLLFMLGLEMRLSELRSVGKVAVISGIAQITFTTVVGFLLCRLLGFESLPSLYLAIGLTFSSTIIIVKLLSDKHDLNSIHGKIAIGMLLVQDFVAIITLILLSAFNTGGQGISLWSILVLLMKTCVLFGWTIVISNTILPKLMNYLARSSEVLFLFSLAWAFGVASLVSAPFIGFSIEIGGFLAGLALANSAQNYQIVSKIKSLRDFFITIFFVTLGMGLVFKNIVAIWLPAVVLCLYILIGNPIILTSILGFLGYRKRTSFFVGLTVAQISEFSMIVVFMGNKLGHVPDEAVSLITIVGIVTFVISTYMIMNNNSLFRFFSPYLNIFERRYTKEKRIDVGEMKNHVVIVGGDQMGQSVLHALEDSKEQAVVLDFNPSIVSDLQKKGVNALFGDIADVDLQERVQLHTAKLVISTIPDIEDNLLLIEAMNKTNRRARIVVMAYEGDQAKDLYKAGADYVILPHLAGGRHLAKILIENDDLELIEKYKKKDLEYIS